MSLQLEKYAAITFKRDHSVIPVSGSKERVRGSSFVSPRLRQPRAVLRVLFVFFPLAFEAIHVKIHRLIGRITLSAPHLAAWYGSADTPKEVSAENSLGPLPGLCTFGALASPCGTYLVFL